MTDVEKNSDKKKVAKGAKQKDSPSPADKKEISTETDAENMDDNDGLLDTDERQAAEIGRIFGTTFPQYLQPIEEIVKEILEGKSNDESLEAFFGMISSLKDASSRMGFDEVNLLLENLQARISMLDVATDKPADDNDQTAILSEITKLKEIAHEMGGEDDATASEPQQTIFDALKNKEGIGDLVLRRLSAAGLVNVDQLLMAKPDEIAAVSGLGLDVVGQVLHHLAPDKYPKNKTSAPKKQAKTADVTTTPDVEVANDIPAELAPLHKQVLQNLKAEVETEAVIEDLKAEIRKLQVRIAEQRAEFHSLEESSKERLKATRQLSNETENKATLLEEIRARRNTLARQCATIEELVRTLEIKLEALIQERNSLETQANNLGRAINGLVDMLGPIRKSVI